MTNKEIKITITLNQYGFNARIAVFSLIYYKLITEHKTLTYGYERWVGEDWMRMHECDNDPIDILDYAENFKRVE